MPGVGCTVRLCHSEPSGWPSATPSGHTPHDTCWYMPRPRICYKAVSSSYRWAAGTAGCTFAGADRSVAPPQALALLPLYGFCYAFWRWSRQDLVDLRFTGREKEVPGQGPPTVPVS